MSLSPFRRTQQTLKLRHFNPIFAALKTKNSKKTIEFRRSHDISWLLIPKDCEGNLVAFHDAFHDAFNDANCY